MTIIKKVHLPVSPDEAFALITQPERLRRWQTVAARVDLRLGGDYRWTISPGHVAAGTYREIEPGKRVVFGWGWEGSADLAPDASTVTITLDPVGDGTELTLLHEGLDAEQEAMHAVGWDHYVDRLQALATTGDTVPDEWAAMPESLDPITSAQATLAVLQPVLRGLTTEDRTRQTPCAAFDGHALAEHLMSSIASLGAMAGATIVTPQEGSLENRVSTMADHAIEAWQARGIHGTVASPGGGEMPAGVALGILSIEFLVHGWDFATTSGQSVHASDDLIGYVRGLADTLVPGGRGTAFADEVPVAADATPLERLITFTGRRPTAA